MKTKKCCFTCINWCSNASGSYNPGMCRLEVERTKPNHLCRRYFRDGATAKLLLECITDKRYTEILKNYMEE